MERLQKLLAQAGIASRRHAEKMIVAGRVRVNGVVVQELGAQADPENDSIMVDNHPVVIESKAYYILNKPRGYLSDRDETAEYKTALDLVPDGRRLFSAGRLDLMSEGMLLLTNDGELANRLTHPRYEHEKEYLALVFGIPDDRVIERLERGILYDGEWLRADSAGRAGKNQTLGEAGRDETWLRIILHEGKKRQIRHMCAALGHPVKRLVRIRIGPLKLGDTKLGEWRKLTREEIALLKSNAKPRSMPPGKRLSSNVRPDSSNVKGDSSNVRSDSSNVKRGASYVRRSPTGARRAASNVKRDPNTDRRNFSEAKPGSINAKRESPKGNRYSSRSKGIATRDSRPSKSKSSKRAPSGARNPNPRKKKP